MSRARIARPCIRCGTPTLGSYCSAHDGSERDARQPYRLAYRSTEYRRARRERFKIAGGICEAVLDGTRCSRLANEAHHLTPLSSASTLEEAIALCTVENLRAVCYRHNPRGAQGTGA